MKLLMVVFLGMAVYGAFIGKLGAAGLALFMCWFTWWGARQLDKRNAEFAADPKHAKPNPDTPEELDRQQCECMRDKI